MAFGGLDLEALRAELTAARQERVALLQQAADLDALPPGNGAALGGGAAGAGAVPLDGFQGFSASGTTGGWPLPTPSAADGAQRLPRKLSWGTPRAPQPSALTADSSVFAPAAAACVASPRAGAANSFALSPSSARPGFGGGAGAFEQAPTAAARAASNDGLDVDVTLSKALGDAALRDPSPPKGNIIARSQGTASAAASGGWGGGKGTDGSNPSRSTSPVPTSATNGTASRAPSAGSSNSGATTASRGANSIGSGAQAAAVPITAVPGSSGSPSAAATTSASGSGSSTAIIPAIKLGGGGGFGNIAAAASRAAAAAATVATTGQAAAPWMVHHTGNVAGAGLDLEAHRRLVLKEVLAAVLGESAASAKLEHMRLDVDSIAAVVRQRTADAAAAAATEAEERARTTLTERNARAIRAAEERGEKAAEELRKILEEDKRRLQAQLDKFRGQLADLEKEKKSLSGRSGQQSRELRETKGALALSKQLLSTAQNSAESKGKALAKAQAELERMRAEATETAAAHAAAMAAAVAEAESQRQVAAQQAEAEKAQIRAEAEEHVRALEETHAAALAAAGEEIAAVRANGDNLAAEMAAALDEVATQAGDVTQAVGLELAALAEDLVGLQADLDSMRNSFREELRAMREAAYAAIGGFHAACCTAARAHAERAAQLMGLDERLQRLGPVGVAALMDDAESLRAALAEAKSAAEAARREAEDSVAARQRAEANAAAAEAELHALTSAHKDLAEQLDATRSELKGTMAEYDRLRDTTERLRLQLRKAKEEAADQQAVLQGSRRELEAARNALRRTESELAAAAAAAVVLGMFHIVVQLQQRRRRRLPLRRPLPLLPSPRRQLLVKRPWLQRSGCCLSCGSGTSSP
ncbi:hypothetical protein Vafri_19476 [Volvox africanus]|uniref:Uncharacterized protein n=1 Tax=Volvox africanus TaxID=51714 RepID=A0A8J4BP28_9CHLO|nr:hypothetical protein Vafri_19476 [Volvox africanus]